MKTVQGYVGEPVVELLANNPGRASHADLERWTDNTPIVWPSNDLSGETFTFVYKDEAGEIRFPIAKLIWFNQYAGVVTSILINTSQQKDTIEHTYGEISGVVQSFVREGWVIVAPLPTLEETKRTISEGQNSKSVAATSLTKGSYEASIRFTSPGKVTSETVPESPSFVAEIEIRDPALDKLQAKKAYDKRQQVNGSRNITLPLSYWVK